MSSDVAARSTIWLTINAAYVVVPLQEELPGDRAYAGRVRCRLLPGLW